MAGHWWPRSRQRSVVLVGAGGAGKSTLARAVADRTSLEYLDLDHERWAYYREIGYDHEHASGLAGNYLALLAYWKPFEAHSVERVMQDHPQGHVIAFGAGQTVHREPDLAERVRRALANHPVVLVEPSPDRDRSWEVLRARVDELMRARETPEREVASYQMANRAFLEAPDNTDLASHVVHTEGRSVAECAEQIVGELGLT